MALNKDEKKEIVEKFGHNVQDTGSVEVQIAMLTKNIRLLTDHCKQNPKDFSSKRGLLKMVCQRRSFLRNLKNEDEVCYKGLIERLGLRK